MHKRLSDDGAADDGQADARKRVSTALDAEDDRPLTVLAALAADPESRMSGLWRDVRQHVLAPMLVPTLATGKYTRVRRIHIPSMAELDDRSPVRHAALGHSHYFFALADSNVVAVSRADPSVVCWYLVSPYMHCGLAALPDGGVAVLDQDGVIYLCPPPRADGAAQMSILDPERREHWAFHMAPFGGLQATRYDVPFIETHVGCGETSRFAVSPDGNTFWLATDKNNPGSTYRRFMFPDAERRQMLVRAYDRSGAHLRTLEPDFFDIYGIAITAHEVCITMHYSRLVIQPLAPGSRAVSVVGTPGWPVADGRGNVAVWGSQPYLTPNPVYDMRGEQVRGIGYPVDALPQSAYPFAHYDRATGSLFSLRAIGALNCTIYELY